MNADGYKKLERLLQIIKRFQGPRKRWRTREMADAIDVNEDTASKYLKELSSSGLLPITRDGHYWILPDGDEQPVKVRLRFSAEVTPRVRETKWHPSQKLQPTRRK